MYLIFPICWQANILDILRTYPYPMPAHTNVIGANPLPPIAGAHPGSLCAKRNRHLSNTSQRHKSYSYPGIKHHFSRFGHETQGPSTSISHRSTLNDIWSLRAAEGFLGVLNGGSTSRTNSCAKRNVWWLSWIMKAYGQLCQADGTSINEKSSDITLGCAEASKSSMSPMLILSCSTFGWFQWPQVPGWFEVEAAGGRPVKQSVYEVHSKGTHIYWLSFVPDWWSLTFSVEIHNSWRLRGAHVYIGTWMDLLGLSPLLRAANRLWTPGGSSSCVVCFISSLSTKHFH